MPFIGELSALLTSFLWSGTSFAFASASIRVGPLQVNINRMILASILLISTILIFGFEYDLSQTQIKNLVISGIIGLVLGDTFLFQSYKDIGARLSMLVMASAPGMAAILAFFFLNEVLSTLAVTGMIITIGGIVLVVSEKNDLKEASSNIRLTGIIYAVLASLGQAGGLIFAKFAFDEGEINGFVATFVRIFSAVVILLFIAALFGRYKNPVRLYRNDKKALLATLIGTVLGPYLGITFSLIAIIHTKVGIAATLMSLMPVIMIPISRYYYRERLSWRAITGAVIAVAGVAILFLR